jgi:hypothetical protein
MSDNGQSGPIFPPWFDKAVKVGGAFLAFGGLFYVVLFAYGASPETLNVGYEPTQPIPFSHAQHAGKLGMDCRYCHNTVEETAMAAVPPAATCMNCHELVTKDSEKVAGLIDAWRTGKTIRWVRVHDLPDYVYFDHSAHVTRGIGCVSCHGRIDRMEVVHQVEPLSMGWCLDCHRNPEAHLRPKDRVTDMDWFPEEPQEEIGAALREANHINPSTNCSTCHR